MTFPFSRLVGLTFLLCLAFSVTRANPTDNRLAIQAMIDALGSGGGTVALTSPGVYDVDVINCPFNTLHKCSLTINHSNTKFTIGPGVTLKLADNQKTNGVYLSILALGPNLSNVTIDGEGMITGNAAGQSGYTEGYTQGSDKENLIGVYGKLTNFALRGLRLEESFSCPIDIPNLGVGSGNWHQNITFENLTINNVGEGIQCQTCRNVHARNISVFNDTGVNVGDSFELAACENFTIDGMYVENQGSIDLFGSKYGTLSNFVIRNCSLGIDLDSFGNVPNCNNVVVSNGVIQPGPGTSMGIHASSTSNLEAHSLSGISLSNITITGHGSIDSNGIAIGDSGVFNAGPVSINNVTVSGMDYCAQTFILTNLSVNGFKCFASPRQNWFVLHPQGVTVGGITADQATGYNFSNIVGDVYVANEGFTGGELTGTFEGIQGTFSDDAPWLARNKMIVRSVSPNNRVESYHSALYYGIESVAFTGDLLARVKGGSVGQTITFHFSQNCVVWDDRDPDAINLVGTEDQLIPAGTYLTVRYDASVSKFVEVSRRN